jgi:outer membrane protein TolC
MRPAVLVVLAALSVLGSIPPSPALAAKAAKPASAATPAPAAATDLTAGAGGTGKGMTAEDAVKIALQKSGDMVRADASVLTARSGLWGAYSFVLPSVSAGAQRNGSFTDRTTGNQAFGSAVVPVRAIDDEAYTGFYGISGRWSVLNPSAIVGLSSARAEMKAAELGHKSARADVTLATKRQFYTAVKSEWLAVVQARALKLARDDERRVRALFEVGSVSKSDLLKAQVATASAELDSTLADHDVITQRLLLASQLGIPQEQLGEIDTTLANEHETLDATGVLDEARKNRPDIQSAEASMRSAELALRSAHWARLPSVSLTGSWTPNSVSSQRFNVDFVAPIDSIESTSSKTKNAYSGAIAVNLPIFDGFATDSRVAAARSQLLNATETHAALLRNLESEVRQSLLSYQEATEREGLARRAMESASENLNLIQQKYNVGSATILDLIDAQVQLQRAASELVSALADIRVAEALVDRVRGKGE